MKELTKFLAAALCITLLFTTAGVVLADTDVKASARNAFYLVAPEGGDLDMADFSTHIGDFYLYTALLMPNVAVRVKLRTEGQLVNTTDTDEIINYSVMVTDSAGQLVTTEVEDGAEYYAFAMNLQSASVTEFYNVYVILDADGETAAPGRYVDWLPYSAGLYDLSTGKFGEDIGMGGSLYTEVITGSIPLRLTLGKATSYKLLMGDVNDDKVVTVSDVSIMLRYIVGLQSIDPQIYCTGDVSYYQGKSPNLPTVDGEANAYYQVQSYNDEDYVFSLTVSDCTYTLRYIVRLILDEHWYYTDGTTVA